MNDDYIRNREGKIIGRFDGNWLRDGTGKLVARYDKWDDTTRDRFGPNSRRWRPANARLGEAERPK